MTEKLARSSGGVVSTRWRKIATFDTCFQAEEARDNINLAFEAAVAAREKGLVEALKTIARPPNNLCYPQPGYFMNVAKKALEAHAHG